MTDFSIDDLAGIIHARRASDARASYTKSLLDKGVAACARKLGEEACETIIAAMQQDPAALRAEAADLLYHLLVLLEASGVTPAEVMDELAARTRQSGHAEKASRTGR